MEFTIKFNRGLILTMVEKDVFEAIQTYRQYIALMQKNSEIEECKITKKVFLKKLHKFVFAPENKNKFSELIPALQELILENKNNSLYYRKCASCFSELLQNDLALELLLEIEKTNDDINIKKDILKIYIAQKNLERALFYAEEIAKEEDFFAENFYNLAMCYKNYFDETNKTEYLKSAILNMEIADKKAACENKIYSKALMELKNKAKDV